MIYIAVFALLQSKLSSEDKQVITEDIMKQLTKQVWCFNYLSRDEDKDEDDDDDDSVKILTMTPVSPKTVK
jgi:hypothetical protein